MSLHVKEIIKDEVCIEDVAHILGLDLKRTGNSLQGNCPAGHDSKSGKCFSINPSKNYFRCFHCGVAGDNIDLVELVKNIEFRDALEFLIREFKPDLLDAFNNNGKSKKLKPEEEEKKRLLYVRAGLYEATYEFGKELLFQNQGKLCLEYLQQDRGYSIEDIKKMAWVYWPQENDIKNHLYRKFPEVNKELIRSLPLTGHYGDNFRLALPYRDRRKVITGFIKRATEPRGITVTTYDGEIHKDVRFDSTPGTCKKDLFNLCQCRGQKEIVIVEGYPDTSYFQTQGLQNVTAIGQGAISKSHLAGLESFKVERVIIAFDNDPPDKKGEITGIKNTRNAVELLLKESSIKPFVLDPRWYGEGLKDPDELVKAKGIDAFKELIENSVQGDEWLAQRLFEIHDITSPLGRERLREESIKIAKSIPVTNRELFVKTIAEKLKEDLNIKPGLDTRDAVETKPLQPKQPTTVEEYFTDTWNAEKLIERHGIVLRYCYERKNWFFWNDKIWEEDRVGRVQSLAKDTVKSLYAKASEINDDTRRCLLIKHVRSSESLQKRKAMVKLAESEDDIPISLEDFDKNKWLLNLNNGTLNLKTGLLQEHNREDYITKIIPINYSSDAKCPIWIKFLSRIFNNNKELIHFVQKAIGYSLTGSTQEQCIFILHGSGANGKSTFLTTIKVILGDYAQQTPSETLMAKTNTGTATNDLARLKGARFVSSVETEEDRAFAEVLIKRLTGNDIIAARYLYGEYFEFIPECKIWLASNHKPRIRKTDPAIWRRIRLIPFAITIPEEERDPYLLDKLQAEKEGILAWAIQGCQAWLKEGLKTADTIREATNDYKSEMDTLGDFINDCCILDKDVKVPAGDLYNRYVKWCGASGEKALSQKAFGLKLAERSFTPGKKNSVRYWSGIGLLDSDQDAFSPGTRQDAFSSKVYTTINIHEKDIEKRVQTRLASQDFGENEEIIFPPQEISVREGVSRACMANIHPATFVTNIRFDSPVTSKNTVESKKKYNSYIHRKTKILEDMQSMPEEGQRLSQELDILHSSMERTLETIEEYSEEEMKCGFKEVENLENMLIKEGE